MSWTPLPPIDTAAINTFLVSNGLRMIDNPCISPDFCLDWPSLAAKLASGGVRALTVHDASGFDTAEGAWLLGEDAATGDFAWLLRRKDSYSGAGAAALAQGVAIDGGATTAFPATFANLIALKNAAQAHDPACTIFPSATGTLEYQSLGIGARMTALHWPACDWAMAQLGLSVTANQNSIPRELVWDVDEMLADELDVCAFKFIGCNIPEGHQGQSVEGMSHGSIVAKVKHGFHKRRLPWGFNADHQPIGGKYDKREDGLVRGSLFATYITYDISHELEITAVPADARGWVAAHVPAPLVAAVRGRVADVGIELDEEAFSKLVAYVWPAMQKMKVRDAKYAAARAAAFGTAVGRAYYREMSVDELPGLTTPATLATILALCEQMGMPTQYVAPAFGWQKNLPFGDNAELERRISAAWTVCKGFSTSIGFHSGSGKSARNYEICGEVTGSRMEVKTSGCYSYELGKALAASSDPADQAFWQEWYSFTLQLALTSAFSADADEAAMARQFITHSMELDGLPTAALFDEGREKCIHRLVQLKPNPEHELWFEYNFLFVLAAGGLAERAALGDHSPAGYRQRARFYGGISDEGRLKFGQGIAAYIIFLARTTGMAGGAACDAADAKLQGYTTYDALLRDIAPPGAKL